jgi:hypothetical protein
MYMRSVTTNPSHAIASSGKADHFDQGINDYGVLIVIRLRPRLPLAVHLAHA